MYLYKKGGRGEVTEVVEVKRVVDSGLAHCDPIGSLWSSDVSTERRRSMVRERPSKSAAWRGGGGGDARVHCSAAEHRERGLAINKRAIILIHNYSVEWDNTLIIVRVPRPARDGSNGEQRGEARGNGGQSNAATDVPTGIEFPVRKIPSSNLLVVHLRLGYYPPPTPESSFPPNSYRLIAYCTPGRDTAFGFARANKSPGLGVDKNHDFRKKKKQNYFNNRLNRVFF